MSTKKAATKSAVKPNSKGGKHPEGVSFAHIMPKDLEEPKLLPNAIVALEKRYLLKDKEGKNIEIIKEMFWRVASAIAWEDEKYDKSPWKGKTKELAKVFYKMMIDGKFLPNSPTLMNAGVKGMSLAACFVLPVEDSMEGIFDSIKHAALTHKQSGGTGFSFSRIRPKNSVVGSTGGVASGPVSFMTVFNAATAQVMAGGRRRGANMGILRVDHPDIMEFISCKDEDGQLSNFNISVAVTEKFMQAVEADEEYSLINPLDGKEVQKLRAKEVFDTLVEHAWKSADPGIVFIDEVNKHNPLPELGEIEASNPCVHGDTLLLTDKGEFPIKDLVGQKVTIWNGSEWSEVEPKITGHNQEMLKIGFKPTGTCGSFDSEPREIICTKYHKFCISDQYTFTRKKASDLVVGECTIPWEEPLPYGLTRKEYCTNSSMEDLVGTGRYQCHEIMSIEEWGICDTVYCVTEPKYNTVIFNNVLTSNCGEQFLHPYMACNLGSLNLAKFYDKKTNSVAWGDLQQHVKIATHFLDNVIDASDYPLPQITKNVQKARPIGLGVMGFADFLFQCGIDYASQEGRYTGSIIFEDLSEIAKETSKELAKQRGAFPLSKDGTMRNSALTTIAPTGTLSLIAGCSSGIEPIFALAFEKHILDGQRLIEVNPYFERAIEATYDKATVQKIKEHVAKSGTCQNCDLVSDELKSVFVTAMDISPKDHVLMQAAFQKHVDNAISKTINMPHDATIQDVHDAYMLAYKTKCKGITVYRDGCKSIQVLYAGTDKKEETKAEVPTTEKTGIVKKRPDIVQGFTQKVRTGLGDMYLTVNEIEGVPFEVFATIGKSGRSVTAKAEAIGRLVSLALRSGIPVADIVNQIKGIGGEHPVFKGKGLLLSIPDAIASVLESKYMKEGEAKDAPVQGLTNALCPDCGSELILQEGCNLCPNCGFSKCGG